MVCLLDACMENYAENMDVNTFPEVCVPQAVCTTHAWPWCPQSGWLCAELRACAYMWYTPCSCLGKHDMHTWEARVPGIHAMSMHVASVYTRHASDLR